MTEKTRATFKKVFIIEGIAIFLAAIYLVTLGHGRPWGAAPLTIFFATLIFTYLIYANKKKEN